MTNLSQICAAIEQHSVKVVSFDIFDTLLERPSIKPLDILILLQDTARQIVGRDSFDYFRARSSIERIARNSLNRSNRHYGEITFEQIYDHFALKMHLSEAQKNALAKAEIEIEKDLLQIRYPMQRLYNKAVSLGKRVICVSDMYHSSQTLQVFLHCKGFDKIEKIYVSSDIKKRKDTGELFGHVLEEEGIKPCEMIHVGDNLHSDYNVPLSLGIPSFRVQSSIELFGKSFAGNCLSKPEWKKADVYQRIALGLYINRWTATLTDSPACFRELKDLGYFGLGPPLWALAQSIVSNTKIQREYPLLLFASRDGYLAQKAYDILANNVFKGAIPSKYIYGGRSLYNISEFCGSARDYILKRVKKGVFNDNYTIGDLFDSVVGDTFLPSDDAKRHITIKTNTKYALTLIKDIIKHRGSEIENILSQRQRRIKKYYTDTIKCNSRGHGIIFDCGYSGSISDNILRLTGCRLDKIYIWEYSPHNRSRDKRNGTSTFILAGGQENAPYHAFWILIEELFSPLEASCIDIIDNDGGALPVFQKSEKFCNDMKNDLNVIQTNALRFVEDAQSLLGKYASKMILHNISAFFLPLAIAIKGDRDSNIRMLENIRFPDFFYGCSGTLGEKIDLDSWGSLLRTDFVNRSLMISTPRPLNCPSLKIAIHLHLFHVDQSPLFINKLSEIDQQYDLFITACSENSINMLKVYFNNQSLPKANNVYFKQTPNKGRDVAPWLVGFGRELEAYDIACHIHSKKSGHFEFGERWRDYLLDNLISKDAVRDILCHFEREPTLGVIFPPIFKNIFNIWMSEGQTPLETPDKTACNMLLERMGLKTRINKHNVFFSAGTMFWYRTEALRPLMRLSLKYEDFPEEPVKISGTLAHAVERLPSIVAKCCGYESRCYMVQNRLINEYADTLLKYPRPTVVDRWKLSMVMRWVHLFHMFCPLGSRRHRKIKAVICRLLSLRC